MKRFENVLCLLGSHVWFCFVLFFQGFCGEPKLYPNAVYVVNEYSVRSSANYSCNPGYDMVGDEDEIIHICGLSNINQLSWNGPLVRCNGQW